MKYSLKFWIVLTFLLAGLVVTILYFVDNSLGWDVSKSWDVSAGDFSENRLVFDENVLTYSQKFDKAIDLIGDIELTEYIVVVDISEQKEYIFTKDGTFIEVYKVSTGSSDMVPAEGEPECDDEDEDCEIEYVSKEMGPSVWIVRSKFDGPFSAFYGERVMMLNKRVGFSWVRTSVALHGTNRPDLLGTPWSLGCVYHENADIIELYELLEVGDFVVAIE